MPTNWRGLILIGLALAAVILIASKSLEVGGARLFAASLIGVFAGVALYHAAFGFTAGWRRFIRERRGAGLRMQLVLVGATALFVLPLIHYGDLIGVRAGGFVFPVGTAVVIGAFLFGLGMQLGGGCGSGTLFTVGGGSTRMVITLAFFMAGGVLATRHFDFWQSLPRVPAVSLAQSPLGPIGAVAFTLAGLAILHYAVRRAELARHGALDRGRGTRSILKGPWSLGLGAAALTAVGVLTVVVLGRPWGITSGLTLWGAQIAHAVGVPVATWDYWSGRPQVLDASIFAAGSSVMNLGLMAGAALAATIAGRFAPKLSLTTRDVTTAMVGGLLMGYGARLAFGCNIGALLGGIASGSLHGWVWFLFAFLGSILGVGLRGALRMDPPAAAGAPQPAPAPATQT